MRFKVGDYVKFKNFDDLGWKYKRGSVGDFHEYHQGGKSKVKKIDSNGKLQLEIDKNGTFAFKPERFVKVPGIEIDESLFQL